MQKNNMDDRQTHRLAHIDFALPQSQIDSIYETVEDLRQKQQQAKVQNKLDFEVDKSYRDCVSISIPTYHWFAGMIWHHIMRTNDHNFQFDITCFGSDSIEFMSYERGGQYKWHVDDLGHPLFQDIPKVREQRQDFTEWQRKLSFSLLLNEEYEGGELQILYPPKKLYKIPKKKGQLVIFDSRALHRVTPVKSGRRDALVGWVVGPRWR